MISILVYGRNDERGYGMHKRVALSLNAMAEVIDQGTSEIIFVDYNTPDHLPTLPELIRDTLTDTARRRLRVLRVRPSVHHRFAEQTPLQVLEPIARNVGLRRSRAQNQWILSTNSDCIVVPRAGRSLVDLVGELPGKSYVLPRFELPERVWETFDRYDAAGTIASAAMWGKEARLDEVVSGEGVVVFDGPGDFQLVRRSELFAIDGFDEDMLLGWHVDHNLAQRLFLRIGPAADLLGEASLYHCGHARQATATHSHGRIENDVGRFVHRIKSADIPHQRDSWGLPDEAIEEINLEQPAGMALRGAINAAVTPLGAKQLAAQYCKASFDNFGYDAGHVAAHVLDLLSTFPRNTAFAYAGVRRDLLEALVKGLPALGFRFRIMVPENARERLTPAVAAQVQAAPLDDMLDAADVLLFEFGLARDETGAARDAGAGADVTDAEAAALEDVAAAYRSLVARERAAREFGRPGRMVVAINAIHNRYEPLISTTLAATPSPFSTRLRFGTILPTGSSAAGFEPLTEEIGRALGRSRPVPPDELSAAQGHLRYLLNHEGVDPERRVEVAQSRSVIEALLRSPRSGGRLGAARERVAERLAAYCAPAAELADYTPDEAAHEAQTGGGARSPSSLAHLADLTDPDWLKLARLFSPSHSRTVLRNGWIWERAQVLRGLAELRPESRMKRALVVSEHPDPLLAALATHFEAIDLADIRELDGSEKARLQQPYQFANGEFLGAASYQVAKLGGAPAPAAAPIYDCIILPHNTAMRSGVVGLGRLLAQLRPLLRPSGLLVFSAEVSLLGQGRVGRPTEAAALEAIPAILSRHAGLSMLGQPTRLRAEDLVLVGAPQDQDQGRPILGIRRDGDVFWPGVWFYRADAGAPAADAEACVAAFADLLLGDQMPALHISERGRRTRSSIVADAGRGQGHVFFGPFMRLPPASYEARIKLARVVPANGSNGHVRVVVETGLGEKIMAQKEVPVSGRRPTAGLDMRLPFKVTAADASAPCEIRMWTDGQAEILVSEVQLSRTGA